MGKEQESPLRSSAIEKEEERGIFPPSLFSSQDLPRKFHLEGEKRRSIEEVSRLYPVRIPEFYAQLMDRDNPKCPIKIQALPSVLELDDSGFHDPFDEGSSKNPVFIKRYPRRAVFIATSQCALYCRFCNRKRFIGKDFDPKVFWDDAFSMMEESEDLNEIIISGGDPFTLSPTELQYILERVKAIDSIRVIRISTRVPIVDPHLITDHHFRVLSRFTPLWIVLHINHPKEITPDFLEVVRRFQLLGFQTVSQTVLLRGVNDCTRTLKDLFERLIQCGVKPYYLFQVDEVKGTRHFKVRLSHGKKLYSALRKRLSGLALPNYVLDLTGGLGKIPVMEIRDAEIKGDLISVNIDGRIGTYVDNGFESECFKCGFCQ